MNHSEFAPCCADRAITPPANFTDLDTELPGEGTAREARRRAAGLLRDVTDTHTHLFPRGYYEALWRWFDANAWSIRFRGDAEQVVDTLASNGISRLVALVYAHKPGVAAALNRFVGEMARRDARVVPVGTVLPGEPGARDVVRDAVALHGARGIKLHCHVQRLAIDDPRVLDVLGACVDAGVPAVVHCGREPASSAYGIDTHAICNVARARTVLERLPGLKLVVPHVGADEFEGYLGLLGEHAGLYLDTSMACAEYFDRRPNWASIEQWSHRIMYGSDMPIVPYEPDRELRLVARRIVSDDAFERIVRGTARAFWSA